MPLQKVISKNIEGWPYDWSQFIWILPTGSIENGNFLSPIFFVETGGDLSGTIDLSIVYLKPGASLSAVAWCSAIIVSPGASVNPVNYKVGMNKILNCDKVNFDYSEAPQQGIDIMIELGYLAPTNVNMTKANPTKSLLFPNPARGSVSISLEGGLRLVSVYNLLGVEALSKEFSGESGIGTLDVSGLSPGVYFVKYRYSSGAERVEKLIIGD